MTKLILSVVASTLLVSSLQAAEEKSEGLNYTLQDQMRYEGVFQPNNTLKDAAAVTNRLVLGAGYTVSGFGGYVEATNIAALTNAYNDTSPTADTTYSAVKDPAQTRLTQAKLTYKNKEFGAVVGRDMYTLDGHRFMGSVAWRQMPQTFDVAALCYKGVENLKVKAAYVFGRHTVGYYDNFLGNEIAGVTQDNTKTNSIMLNANYQVTKEINVRIYDYMISSTHDTLGGMVEGTAGSFGYKVEAALQKTASLTTTGFAAPASIDPIIYANLELSTKALGAKFVLGHEILGSNGTAGFTTPWATLHKFNGWADVYLGGTPKDGLADTSLGAIYTNEKIGTFKAFLHTFHDAKYSTLQGTEIDAVYTKALGIKGLSALVKAAFFIEGLDGAVSAKTTDTTKAWAMLTYNLQ